MSEIVIDVRGFACPHPVIETQKALDALSQGKVIAIVDNPAAKDNLIRLARSRGCGVSAVQKDGDFYVEITVPAVPFGGRR